MQDGPTRSWLTSCLKSKACYCQQQAGRASQILTYILFKTQRMPLSATSRKGQPILTYTLFGANTMFLSETSRSGQLDPDLQTVQNPQHALVSKKQEARFWLTACSKPRACSSQQQARSQILTYSLYKFQSIPLSEISRKNQPDPDLHAVQSPEHALVSNKQEGPARSWLTLCIKPRACSCQLEAGRASQILTYTLFKTQSMLLSATSRKGQPDSDLQAIQHPEHALVSNKQGRPRRSWLTPCSKPRACFFQQNAGRASQILTYKLFKTQSTLLSALSTKGQPHPNLQPVQNQEHALVSNKQEAKFWLTACSKPEHALVSKKEQRPDPDLQPVQNPEHALVSKKQKQPNLDLQPVQNQEHALVRNKQERPSLLTPCSQPRACSCQLLEEKASQILTYQLVKTQSMLSSDTSTEASQMMTYRLFKSRACSCQQ